MSCSESQAGIPVRKEQGAEIPALGLGTAGLRGEEGMRAILKGLALGFRHLDTAQIYENEDVVGRALTESGIDRAEVFITTKAQWNRLGRQDILTGLAESLRKLQTDYVDLFLVHWPSREVPVRETLDAMCELQEEGAVRHIGVSNFTVKLLREALDIAGSPLVCNQVEYHPYLSQASMLAFCREKGIVVTAYSPLALGRTLKDETLERIGSKYGKSPAQVAIRWFLQQEMVAAIPRSSKPEHLRANLDVFDFALSAAEMTAVSGLNRGLRLCNPSIHPEWD